MTHNTVYLEHESFLPQFGVSVLQQAHPTVCYIAISTSLSLASEQSSTLSHSLSLTTARTSLQHLAVGFPIQINRRE